MANAKLTKREIVTMMMSDEHIKTNEIFMGYLAHEIELLDKKAGSKKPTKSQVENESIKDTILEVLARVERVTVSELIKTDVRLNGFSNQKMSALLKQLVEAGKVNKVIDKKSSYFSLAR